MRTPTSTAEKPASAASSAPDFGRWEAETTVDVPSPQRRHMGGVAVLDALRVVERIPMFAPRAVSPERRRARLESLPAQGFSPESRATVIGQITSIGLPVSNFRGLAHERNENGREGVLGSWGIGKENYGTFSVYDRLYAKDISPRERLATLAHESGHANTPFERSNAHLYGGERQRKEAAELVTRIADQTLMTGKYLTAYHKSLAKQFTSGEISKALFDEETMAIATELALSNRKKLDQVQAAQHAKLTKLQSVGLAKGVKPVDLLSRGDVPSGIDKGIIALLKGAGVSDVKSLRAHVQTLKTKYFPADHNPDTSVTE